MVRFFKAQNVNKKNNEVDSRQYISRAKAQMTDSKFTVCAFNHPRLKPSSQVCAYCHSSNNVLYVFFMC